MYIIANISIDTNYSTHWLFFSWLEIEIWWSMWIDSCFSIFPPNNHQVTLSMSLRVLSGLSISKDVICSPRNPSRPLLSKANQISLNLYAYLWQFIVCGTLQEGKQRFWYCGIRSSILPYSRFWLAAKFLRSSAVRRKICSDGALEWVPTLLGREGLCVLP
jgi:hypothetical protein